MRVFLISLLAALASVTSAHAFEMKGEWLDNKEWDGVQAVVIMYDCEDGIGIRAVQIMMPDNQNLGEGYEALLTGAFSGSASGPIGADLEFYTAEDWHQIYGGTEATEAIVYQVADLNETGEFLARSGLTFRPAKAGYRGYIIEPWDASGVYVVFSDGT